MLSVTLINGMEITFIKENTNEGLWVGFFTDITENIPYKYEIISLNGQVVMKADPYALQSELRPATASITPNSIRHMNGMIKIGKKKRKNLMRIHHRSPSMKFI